MRLLPPVAAAVLTVSLLATPTAAPAASPDERSTVTTAATKATAASKATGSGLKVRKLITGLDVPWDVRSIGKGRLIFTQRDRATLTVWKNGKTRKVKRFPSRRIWVSGETGLAGLEVDPAFAQNRRVYTCGGWRKRGGRHDVRVIAWTLNAKARKVTGRKVLVKGFPTTSGRHGGCRLLIADDGSLFVGTGDAAVGANPRNLDSLGGKTLRINRMTGAPWPSNPFAGAQSKRRYVHSFGHRNVQGLAQRRDGSVWSIEHGSTRDDEVNLLVPGGDYGWHPVPGYNESVPMTDHGLPGTQIDAKWRSGSPTVATSGGAFVYGKKWGSLNRTLAVACLKASRVIFMKFNRAGKLKRTRVPAALRKHGRLRSVTLAPDGALLVTTSNGGGNDSILRVTPK